MGIDNLNIDKLLRPYRHGGTKAYKVKRTIGTISNKLVFDYKFSPEIVGAAMYRVFGEMAFKELKFKGDGSWGSEGRELFSCIKAQCVDIAKGQSQRAVMDHIKEMVACTVPDCPMRTKVLTKRTKLERFKLFMFKPRGWWRL